MQADKYPRHKFVKRVISHTVKDVLQYQPEAHYGIKSSIIGMGELREMLEVKDEEAARDVAWACCSSLMHPSVKVNYSLGYACFPLVESYELDENELFVTLSDKYIDMINGDFSFMER